MNQKEEKHSQTFIKLHTYTQSSLYKYPPAAPPPSVIPVIHEWSILNYTHYLAFDIKIAAIIGETHCLDLCQKWKETLTQLQIHTNIPRAKYYIKYVFY